MRFSWKRSGEVVAALTAAAFFAFGAPCEQQTVALPFEDDFADPASGWPSESDDVVSLSYDDGGYRVVAKTSTPSWTFVPMSEPVETVSVETDAAYAGGTGAVAYGVLCYDDRLEDGYIFAVSPSGGYAIFRETPDEIRVVSDGVGDFGGRGRSLSVRAACVATEGGETKLALYVDDSEVVVAEDEGGVSRFGGVGIYVQSDEGRSDVLFDDFRAEEPAPAEVEAIRAGRALDQAPAAADDATPGHDVFADDFSRPGDRWPTASDVRGQLAYRDGAYEVAVATGSTSQEVSQTLARSVPALRIDAELVQRTPSRGEDGYGVACVAGDVAFVFEIDAEARRYAQTRSSRSPRWRRSAGR